MLLAWAAAMLPSKQGYGEEGSGAAETMLFSVLSTNEIHLF
jgi:hypothetical protein